MEVIIHKQRRRKLESRCGLPCLRGGGRGKRETPGAEILPLKKRGVTDGVLIPRIGLMNNHLLDIAYGTEVRDLSYDLTCCCLHMTLYIYINMRLMRI